LVVASTAFIHFFDTTRTTSRNKDTRNSHHHEAVVMTGISMMMMTSISSCMLREVVHQSAPKKTLKNSTFNTPLLILSKIFKIAI
jgi:hypothetical protein